MRGVYGFGGLFHCDPEKNKKIEERKISLRLKKDGWSPPKFHTSRI
jgi:hypothetical protein